MVGATDMLTESLSCEDNVPLYLTHSLSQVAIEVEVNIFYKAAANMVIVALAKSQIYRCLLLER